MSKADDQNRDRQLDAAKSLLNENQSRLRDMRTAADRRNAEVARIGDLVDDVADGARQLEVDTAQTARAADDAPPPTGKS